MIPLSDYDFSLPSDRIAQEPLNPRDHSRLLVLDRSQRSMQDQHVYDLPHFLRAGDLLVTNDTKVIPARLYAHKPTGAKVEVFLLEERSINTWMVMVRPAKRVKVGDTICFTETLEAIVTEHGGEGLRTLTFNSESSVRTELLNLGQMPLPPYIAYKEDRSDFYKERYQTVFAKQEGAVAAPTAGLHFTPELLKGLAEKGVAHTSVTLHVGLGTFKPVETPDLTKHPIHSERYSLSQETVDLIAKTKQQGGRVVAVGTTVVRLLEGIVASRGQLEAGQGQVKVFIYPPFQFQVVDALMTNFHLPKSTLLALVSAFYDRESIFRAYSHAIMSDYRFFSFGDAMLVI